MAEQFADVQETVATAPAPAEAFAALSRDQQREVFFVLPETVRERLVADLDREELQRFLSRLDPDEATDVLGYAAADVREAVLADLDSGSTRRASAARKSSARGGRTDGAREPRSGGRVGRRLRRHGGLLRPRRERATRRRGDRRFRGRPGSRWTARVSMG